jgi:hypothetical protein
MAKDSRNIQDILLCNDTGLNICLLPHVQLRSYSCQHLNSMYRAGGGGGGSSSELNLELVAEYRNSDVTWFLQAPPGKVWDSTLKQGRSQWPRGLRRRSAAERLLWSWFRIPPGAWIFVSCTVFVLLGRGLCDGPIPRPEEPYRLRCVLECDQAKIKKKTLYTYCEQVGRKRKDHETKP